MQIMKTTDYNRFKTIVGNRQLNQLHVDRLADSITQRNLLEMNPIVVNSEYEVIDGQHRLAAARKLRVSIYYIKNDNLEISDIVTSNLNRENWSFKDYLDYYCDHLQLPDYINFRDLIKKENITIQLALAMIGNLRNSKVGKEFKRGNFKLPNTLHMIKSLSQARHVIEYIKGVNGNLKFLHTQTFMKALVSFLGMDGVKFDVFLQALEKHLPRITPQINQQFYVDRWILIYNWGKKKNIINEAHDE